MIIRHATSQDIEALLSLASTVDGGMTSMPADKTAWVNKLRLVTESLEEPVHGVQESTYFLVLEDPQTCDIVGTAGIHTGVGAKRPFYNYKLAKHVKASDELDMTVTCNTLNLVNDFTGETELTSLYLKPEYRRGKIGQFLSRSRFMLMSDFPERFGETIFAEVRGWLDAEGNSPFWEHMGSKFFNMPYQEADFISGVHGSQFISDLMPRFPIYLELLPDDAVQVIGKPHNDSAAAMRLLEKEGFRYEGAVDIFDAGPVVQCHRQHIDSIHQTRCVKLEGFVSRQVDQNAAINCMVSNSSLHDYRLIMGPLTWLDDEHVVMTQQDAQTLGVSLGATLQTLVLR